MRIVSLVPSTTASLCEAGFEKQIVGCTSFCVEPPRLAKNATVIGGTKTPSIDLIKSLNPSHVFANQEENRKEDVEEIQKFSAVDLSFPRCPQDLPKVMRTWGAFLSQKKAFDFAIEPLEVQIEMLESKSPEHLGQFIYLIWKNPYMAVGGDTFISKLLELLGFKNALGHLNRYPEVSLEDISKLDPKYLFLSTEPFPFRSRDARGLISSLDSTIIKKVDGRLASWHGIHTLEAIKIFSRYGIGAESKLFRNFNI